MLEDAATLPDDPDELRAAAASLVSLVKSQALRIAKLEHELAGHRRHRFGVRSESLDQPALGLEEQEIAAATAGKAAAAGETAPCRSSTNWRPGSAPSSARSRANPSSPRQSATL